MPPPVHIKRRLALPTGTPDCSEFMCTPHIPYSAWVCSTRTVNDVEVPPLDDWKSFKASSVPNNIEEGETLLDHLVKLTDDPVILKDETLNIMIAGRDTTAATLTFVVYMLALHPEVVQCLRAEILERVGPTRKPTYDDIRKMKYLGAYECSETLRLYPPVPFDTRKSINATTLANLNPQGKPWYVPLRTGVAYSVFMMHRRTDLWGPDAHNFDPNRLLDKRLHKYLIPNPFIFLPFNAGPRICLGQQKGLWVRMREAENRQD
ncbi:hypothetical protein M0805_004636 [Coniferiporia weirii]|nr:hypothetical protein M0805_004636 [Coniferiporia weirii]